MRLICLWLGLIALAAMPLTALDTATPYKELAKSKPVVINGLEFVAVTEAQWLELNPPMGKTPIDVQLWITNKSKNDLIFRVFDTFRVIVKDSSDKELPVDGGRDGTKITKPVLIRPGETYCLSRLAVLSWTGEGTVRSLSYDDQTGSWDVIGELVSGKYTLSFWVGNKQDDEGMKGFMRNHKLSGELPPCWKGEGTTAEVPFEILDPPPGY
jgi:hypothetical protein